MTIGERAVAAINQAAEAKGILPRKERKELGISYRVMRGWEKENLCPNAFFLAQMAKAGYDIFWILTGEEHG